MESGIGNRNLPEWMLEGLRVHFSLVGDDLPFLDTLTKKYFRGARKWFLLLLCSPLIALGALLISARGARRFVTFLFVSASITVAMACTLVEGPTIRFLHSLGWMVFLISGYCLDRILRRMRNRDVEAAGK
jgi:hypothetical protein